MEDLIREIHRCQNMEDLDAIRIDIIEVINECQDTKIAKKLQREFTKQKNRLKRPRRVQRNKYDDEDDEYYEED